MVNGKRLDLMIEPRVTLLDALRMRADLTGNKRGCDRGACGACTMIVDGRPVYSCSTLAIDVQGKQIRNVDGLANGATLHPVQQAFCDKDALMCGFCTPGFIMASVALLEKHPSPTPEQIRQGPRRQHLPLRHVLADLRGGVEREGGDPWLTHSRARPRLRRLQQHRRKGRRPRRRRPRRQPRRRPAAGWRPQGQPPPPPADPKYHWPPPQTVLGTSVKRLDGPDKVTGRAKYTFDISRPGMLYGRIVRSPHPHARIVSIDLAAAQQAPGVKAALVWRDPANPQRNTVMYQGDEVAAVAADTEERAIDAARLVKVEYEVLPHVILVDQALSGIAPAVFTGGNVRQGQTQETGDLAAGFKQAAHVVEETYSTHVITHVCLESHGAVCEWDGDKPDRVGLHAGRQRGA